MTTPGAVRVSLFGQAPMAHVWPTDATPYTLGVQFRVDVPVPLTAVWFWSSTGAQHLPGTIACFQVASMSSGTLLGSRASVPWSGSLGSGWVRGAFATPIQLQPLTNYIACVFTPLWQSFYTAQNNYFTGGGPGASGIRSGVLFAPPSGGGVGQMRFRQATVLGIPDTEWLASNYWVDPEIEIPAAVTLPRGWDGAAWREGRLRGWDGSQWRGARVWDGQQWRSMTG